MRRLQRSDSHRSIIFLFLVASLPVILAAALISCGGFTTTGMQSNGTGTIRVTLTDPPTCKAPEGNFLHVYVTIRSVQANISDTADDNSSTWVELAPQLVSAPMQIDLLSQPATTCLLATLGSNTALPAGTYQQIRLLLVPNGGMAGTTPPPNNCGSGSLVWNCVVLVGNVIQELQLSSQANTGLKIPPGQIVGGPISVAAGQDVDLNIDFNTCASIIQEGNGKFRLKPVLTAQQVSTSTGISGTVVDQTTSKPIGGTVIVALEKQDSTGTDVIMEEANTNSSGFFNFCPIPSGSTFDVVVVAINGGTAYNATVAVGVPGNTNLGVIPLYPETGTATGPATFTGVVTATTGTAPAKIDALVSAIQPVPLSSSTTLPVTIPPEAASTPPSGTNLAVDLPTGCPTNTNCATYTLIVPASNPSVGIFSASGPISYSTPVPASSGVPYSIRADAFAPMMGGTTDCVPSTITVTKDSSTAMNPLKALPSPPPITPMEIDFKGCM